jgi:hypothetical protein
MAHLVEWPAKSTHMNNLKVRTAVAFVVFNRPDLTQRVFAAIAAVQPAKLLVIADGPRADRAGEAGRVAHVRSIIARVDWECDVRTNYSDTNLGCKRRLSSGLDWVFHQVPECIVLEDDCLPDPSFFQFCDDMLERYRDVRRVFQINGTNFQKGAQGIADSYYFSRQSHVWGWASWSNRWLSHYDVAVSAWPRVRDEGSLEDVVGGKQEAKYWGAILESLYRGEIDTWDYQWAFACMLNDAAIVTPTVNLISNIGFGDDATHTNVADHPLADLPRAAMQFPLRHPVGMFCRSSLDREYFDAYSSIALRRRLLNRIRRLLAR